MNPISFEDAWIFLGMKYSENESADYYARLVGCFDFINHSIPGYDEFISAYNKLLYISAIKNENNRICILEFGNSIYKSALSKSGRDSQPWAIAELIRVELKPYKLKSACRQSPLSAQEYSAAIARYNAGNIDALNVGL